MPQLAIIVPGIMGSTLELNGKLVWPGPLKSLVLRYKMMKELMHEDLVPVDCIRSYFITNQYQQLIDDLERCDFHENDRTLVVAAYDWRRDNATAAERLAGHIDDAIVRHGANTEISIIGHSMGGLISRYYLESNKFNERPGYSNIRRLITLATPHIGAAVALPVILGYEKRLFLSADQVLLAASDPRYPAAYQLLPPPGEPFAWDDSPAGQLTAVDVYEPEIARRLGLVQANLDAAREFHSGLDFRRRPAHVRYFCFAGTRQTTTTHVKIRRTGDNTSKPVKVEEKDGGDGTVPTWSGYLSGVQRMFVGGEHGTIYQNSDLRGVLATLLGKEGVPAGVPEEVQVALRDKVVEPHDLVHVAITFPGGIRGFSGVLTVERAEISARTGKVQTFSAPVQAHPVEYKGLDVETISLTFEAPDYRGVYRVAFRDDLRAQPSGYDELVIQQPPKP